MNDRLKDIYDKVDDYFTEKKLINNIVCKNTHNNGHYINNSQNNEKQPESEFRKILNNILQINVDDDDIFRYQIKRCKFLLYEIKYEGKNIEDMHFKSLSTLVFTIMYVYSNNKRELYELFKKYIFCLEQLDIFLDLVMKTELRKCLFKYMKYGNQHYIDFKKIMLVKKLETVNTDKIIKYKNAMEEFKNIIRTKCILLMEYFSKNVIEPFFSIYINIINCYLEKIDKYYRYINKFNKPELEIYNHIINLKIKYTNIIQAFTNITIPVCRYNIDHNLQADILIVLDINNKIYFAIIEYDGPTHYNINDFRFVDSIVLCDMEKNNYCINNNVSLLRLHYKKPIDECFNEINSFIKTIIETKSSVHTGIPSNDFYQDILDRYYKRKTITV